MKFYLSTFQFLALSSLCIQTWSGRSIWYFKSLITYSAFWLVVLQFVNSYLFILAIGWWPNWERGLKLQTLPIFRTTWAVKVKVSVEALSFGFWTLFFFLAGDWWLHFFQVSTPAKIETTGNYSQSSKLIVHEVKNMLFIWFESERVFITVFFDGCESQLDWLRLTKFVNY